MGDHFGDKVPDFKKQHQMTQRHAPLTEEIVDPDDLLRVMPHFVPTQTSPATANEIAIKAAEAAKSQMESLTEMSDFQLNYLQRCIYDAVQQMMLGQDMWSWQFRYEHAFARGDVPDPRAD